MGKGEITMKISVGLTFPGALKDECVICFLCKKFQVTINIIEASFSISSGWAIIGIEGQEKEIEKVFEHLKSRGINWGDKGFVGICFFSVKLFLCFD